MVSGPIESEILSEIHTMEKCDFLRLIIHSQMINSLFNTIGNQQIIVESTLS